MGEDFFNGEVGQLYFGTPDGEQTLIGNVAEAPVLSFDDENNEEDDRFPICFDSSRDISFTVTVTNTEALDELARMYLIHRLQYILGVLSLIKYVYSGYKYVEVQDRERKGKIKRIWLDDDE